MTDILVKLFVKDYKDVEKVSVRTAYGVLASGVGIFCNVLLTIAKMVIGILLHSVRQMQEEARLVQVTELRR